MEDSNYGTCRYPQNGCYAVRIHVSNLLLFVLSRGGYQSDSAQTGARRQAQKVTQFLARRHIIHVHS